MLLSSPFLRRSKRSVCNFHFLFSSLAKYQSEGYIFNNQPEINATSRILSDHLTRNEHSEVLSVLRNIQPTRTQVFFWNSVIKLKISSGHHGFALHLFDEMREYGWIPDGYTYPYVFKACGELSSLIFGSSVHALAFITGHVCSNVCVGNAAVAMFGRCGQTAHAQQLFDEMLEKGVYDIVSWNSIMAVYAQTGEQYRTLRIFEDMKCKFLLPADRVSLVTVLPSCSSAKAWRNGMEIHGYAIKRCLSEDVFVGNAIVDMYAKCGLMDQAKDVFDGMKTKDVISWNSLVTGYSQVGRFDDALKLFDKMREKEIESNVVTWSAVISGYTQRGLGYEALDVFREMISSTSLPNEVTIVSVLSGCAAVGALLHGKETHCYTMKNVLKKKGGDYRDDIMVINGLIDMYAKCKKIDTARSMFDSVDLNRRNVVTWTVMIGGYAQHGEAGDALLLFSELLKANITVFPNGFTISSLLVACARLGSLRVGREIHAYVLRNRFEGIVFVLNCLIDMYAKSGEVDAARVVFDRMVCKNAVSWTSLMTGYGIHGRGEEAVEVFEGMIGAGFPVDDVTFVVVLYACNHSGMVEKGMNYFNNMKKDFGVVPGLEHYACAVDLLGRSG